MLDVDEAAVLRATALLRAFDDGDREHWAAVLASDQDDPRAPYATFCAMTALLDRALDWITHETGRDRDELLELFTAAFVDLLRRCRDEQEGER